MFNHNSYFLQQQQQQHHQHHGNEATVAVTSSSSSSLSSTSSHSNDSTNGGGGVKGLYKPKPIGSNNSMLTTAINNDISCLVPNGQFKTTRTRDFGEHQFHVNNNSLNSSSSTTTTTSSDFLVEQIVSNISTYGATNGNLSSIHGINGLTSSNGLNLNDSGQQQAAQKLMQSSQQKQALSSGQQPPAKPNMPRGATSWSSVVAAGTSVGMSGATPRNQLQQQQQSGSRNHTNSVSNESVGHDTASSGDRTASGFSMTNLSEINKNFDALSSSFASTEEFNAQATNSSTTTTGTTSSASLPTKSHIKRSKMIYSCKFGEFGVNESQFTEPSGVRFLFFFYF